MHRMVQGAKNAFKFSMYLFSPSNLKHQIGVMQTMSIPELIVGLFKTIFYAFYYSGYGVVAIIKYLLINVLMSLMRGPTEEVVEEQTSEDNRFGMKALPSSSDDSSGTMQAFGMDSSKEDNAPHESTALVSATSEESGENTAEDGSAELGDQSGETEPPMTLV